MVLASGKFRCAPSSPCSRRSGRCAWLRAAVLLSSPALRAMADALSGRDGTGGALAEPEKLGSGCSRPDHDVPLGIECDLRDRRPIAGLAAPALWVGLAGSLVKVVLGHEHGAVVTGMALCRGHVFDAAVPVDVVVPMDEKRAAHSRAV
jgi:hypothetical protein